MNFTGKMPGKFLIITCLIFMWAIALLNCRVFIKDRLFLSALLSALLIALIYVISRYMVKMSPLFFSVILFAAAFALKTSVALYYNVPPTSDFLKFYNAAVQAAKGDFSFSSNSYFSLWSYQTGIVFYYAMVIKLFGNGLLFLKIGNCLFMAGSNVLLYLISRTLASEKYARFISLLYMIYPAPYFLASALTNQHISNFFILLGIYSFISRRKANFRSVIPSAFFIAVGNALRPQGIIVIMAITGCLLLNMLGSGDKKQIVNLILSAVCVLIIYTCTMQGLSLGVRAVGLNANGLENRFALYKFVVGLNYETNGGYSRSDAEKLIYISDPKTRDKKSLQLIKERISRPEKLARLILKKQNLMWAIPDDSVDWGFSFYKNTGVKIFGKNVSYPVFRRFVQNVEKCFYIFILFMAISGLMARFRTQNNQTAFIVILIMLLLNFGIYSLIEIQNRYRDFQVMLMFLVSAAGIEMFIDYGSARISALKSGNTHFNSNDI